MKHRLTSYIFITLAMCLFGMSFVWSEGLLTIHHFPPQSLIFIRLLIGSGVLLLFLAAAKRFQRPKKKDIKWFLLLALFEPFIYFLGETNGLRITQSPSLGAVVLSLSPLFCMIACFAFFKERPAMANVVGMLFTLPGVALVMFTDNLELHAPIKGVLLLFVAAVSTAGYAMILRKLETYSSITIVAFQNVIGAVYFLPLALRERTSLTQVQWSWEVWYPLIMLSVFVSVLAFVLYVSSVKRIGVTQANLFTALIPVIATMAAFLMGRENLTWQQITGVGIVISGLIFSQYRRTSKRINETMASFPEG